MNRIVTVTESESDRVGAVINALLDLHFAEAETEEEKAFVEGHRYSPYLDDKGHERPSRF